MALTKAGSDVIDVVGVSAAIKADQTVGGVGEALLRTTGFKNILINGNFDLWQRGTTSTTNGYLADRWTNTVAGTTTFAQELTDVPVGSGTAIKWTTGAVSSYGQTRQFIETAVVKTLRGKTLTASALVKCSAGYTGNAQLEIYYSTTTDAANTFAGTNTNPTFTGQVVSTGYTQITGTFTVPSNAVGLVVGVVPTVTQGSGVSLLVSQVQLEVGSVVTPFELRPIGLEVSLCQRYYQIMTSIMVSGNNGAGGSIFVGFPLPVPMHAPPTVTIGSGFVYANSSALNVNVVTNNYVRLTIIITASGYGMVYDGSLTFESEV